MTAGAAFFDLDRTVLRIDTGMSWMKFQYRRGEIGNRALAKAVYWSLLYRFAILDMEELADRLVAGMTGQPEAELVERCRIWQERDVLPHIAPRAARAIETHRQRGEQIVLLTGATQYSAEPVAADLGIGHTLCSRLEVVSGQFTGRWAARCFGHHKVSLAERFAADHGVDLARSTFYSDSYNDLPMLSRVGVAVAVNPDTRLRRHARGRGWRIEEWA